MRKIVLAIVLIFGVCKAEMHLQGEISSESIDSTANPYVIEKTIIVLKERKSLSMRDVSFSLKAIRGLKCSEI